MLQQQSYKFGVQFHAGEAGEVTTGSPDPPPPLIGAGRKQGVKDIGYRNQFRMGVDLTFTQAQITAAVKTLMVL